MLLAQNRLLLLDLGIIFESRDYLYCLPDEHWNLVGREDNCSMVSLGPWQAGHAALLG